LFTVKDVLEELFPGVPSGGDDALMLELFIIVEPFASLQLTLATTVNVAVSPLAMVPFVQVMVPLLPTGNVLQLQPAGFDCDTTSKPAGTESLKVTPPAGAGPLLMTSMVYITLLPASIEAVLGDRVLLIAKSARA
jgi:hypothetical protein